MKVCFLGTFPGLLFQFNFQQKEEHFLLWLWTLACYLDLYKVKGNHLAKYLGQRSFRCKVSSRHTDRQTHTHSATSRLHYAATKLSSTQTTCFPIWQRGLYLQGGSFIYWRTEQYLPDVSWFYHRLTGNRSWIGDRWEIIPLAMSHEY